MVQRQKHLESEQRASERSLHFCMLTSFYPPHNFGGDGIFVQRLARALVSRGHRVTVIYCQDAYKISGGDPVTQSGQSEPGIEVHALKSFAGALSPLVTHQLAIPGFKSTSLKNIFAANTFDVTHFHNISLLGGPGILDYGSGVKLYTAHEYWLVCPLSTLWKSSAEPCTSRTCVSCTIHSGRPPQLWRFSGLLERKLAAMDALLAPSEFAMQKHAEMGLPLPFQHFPNFLPQTRHSQSEKVPQQLNQRPFFLMVGRLEQSKGFQEAIAVFGKYANADLVIVGTGQYENTLRELAAGTSNIRFTGRLTYDELTVLYRSATAVIVPSIWYEPFGLVVLEAFAQCTPVLVNRAGALPELVERSDGGLIYENADELVAAINRLIASEALRTELGHNGYAALQAHWSEDVHLKNYLELITQIQSHNESRS